VPITRQVHAVPAGAQHFYTDLSIWDIHRTQYPLMILWQPELAADIARCAARRGLLAHDDAPSTRTRACFVPRRSMMAMNDQQGRLPKWPLANGETGSMIGLHSVPMLAEALEAGLGSLVRAACVAPKRAERCVSHSAPGAGQSRDQRDGRARRHGVLAARGRGRGLPERERGVCMPEPAGMLTRRGWSQRGYSTDNPCRTLDFSLDDHCAAMTATRLNNSGVAKARVRNAPCLLQHVRVYVHV
jgi:putative alpha-1,2-mannosidase